MRSQRERRQPGAALLASVGIMPIYAYTLNGCFRPQVNKLLCAVRDRYWPGRARRTEREIHP